MSKIIVDKINNSIITCIFDGFDLIRICVSNIDKESVVGNMYVAKVKNIVKNIDAAFVEVANGQMCYMDLKTTKQPIFLNNKKDNILKIGDEILVEVVKEAQQKKEPVVTSSFSCKGEYVILTHGKNYIGVSGKIKDKNIRKKLQEQFQKYVTEDYGFILRTKAMDADIFEIDEEVKSLVNEYNTIIDKARYAICFSCVKKGYSEYITDIKDMLRLGIEEIVIEDDNIFADVSNHLSGYIDKDDINLRHYKDDTLPLRKLYSIVSNIHELLKEKVWLKSGGNIVIQRTEALTAIDVNTSKAIKLKGDNEKTFFKVNMEAAKEIAKQISLRNIGGIIIIDFIDMQDENHKRWLLDKLQEYLDRDYVKANVVDMTKLNLVEVTRQKVKQPLEQHIKHINGGLV